MKQGSDLRFFQPHTETRTDSNKERTLAKSSFAWKPISILLNNLSVRGDQAHWDPQDEDPGVLKTGSAALEKKPKSAT